MAGECLKKRTKFRKHKERESDRECFSSHGSLGMGKCMVGPRDGKRLGVRGGEGRGGAIFSLRAMASISVMVEGPARSGLSLCLWSNFCCSVWSVFASP